MLSYTARVFALYKSYWAAMNKIFIYAPLPYGGPFWSKLLSQQPRSQSSSAISDVTSPVKLVGKIRRGRYRARL